MKRKLIILSSIVFLLSCVPWFFFRYTLVNFYGLPGWALHILGSTFVYAIILVIFINKYWSHMADEDSESDSEE
ncbi:MAG: hypothetical protein IIA45_10695 [Bacteroidetes bacterium]|nr:hypothetical protein [Bacteroidota bacterium]